MPIDDFHDIFLKIKLLRSFHLPQNDRIIRKYHFDRSEESDLLTSKIMKG